MEEQHPTAIARDPEHNVVVVDMSRDGLLAVAVRPSGGSRPPDAGLVVDGEGDAGDG